VTISKHLTRKLLSGRIVKEELKRTIVIDSKCPKKWVCIDLENGNIWVKDRKYRRPNSIEKKEALKILNLVN